MSRRQLLFDILSMDYEERINDSTLMDCSPSTSDVIPRSLMFEDDDSRDSGFESHDSENEASSPGVTGTRINCSAVRPTHDTRKALFSRKRSRDEEERVVESKKLKVTEDIQLSFTHDTEMTSDGMKAVVERMDRETDLIGDGSQIHRLPTVSGRHKDLKSVSQHTVSQLLEGKYDDVISGYQIIDCRYPYEYEGGHIEGAMNCHTEAMITEWITKLHNGEFNSKNILVFHCEFSSERAPKLLRHLRSMDRKLNSHRYPFLFYPEVYLLDGGYKAFYRQNQTHCLPRNYVPMLHEDYSRQLRHFRVKSKSWTAGEKQNMRSRRDIIDVSPMKFSL